MSSRSSPEFCYCRGCGCNYILSDECRNASANSDRRLLNWEKMLSVRRSLHKTLGKRLNREPGELLMNAAEEQRKVKEEKQLLANASIQYPPDRYRGCVHFWKFPPELAYKCETGKHYYVQTTPAERCEIPDVEFVDVHEDMMSEKDVLPRARNSYQLWKNIAYREERFKQVEEQLELIQPHLPVFKDLLIEGKSISRDDDKLESSPSDKLRLPQKTKSQLVPVSEQFFGFKKERACVCINGKEFVAGNDSFKKIHDFFVTFEDYDTGSNKSATEHLALYNNGNVALRFYWKSFYPYNLFSDITSKKTVVKTFFFNKNELVVLPGQKIDFPFWFKTKIPGTYSECWELQTLPQIWPNQKKILIKLKAVAYLAELDLKCERITKLVEDGIKETLIKECLSDIISTVTFGTKDISVSTYAKRQIFEAANTKNDPLHLHPKYKYDKHIVSKFEDLYSRIKQKHDPTNWNYSVDDLMKTAKKYDVANKSNKNRTIYAVNEAKDLVEKLQKAPPCPNRKREHYNIVYSILNACFTKISQQAYDAEVNLRIQAEDISLSKIAETFNEDSVRFDFEQGDVLTDKETAFKPEILSQQELAQQRPRPENLLDIPEDNPKKLYREYHGIPDTPPAKETKKGKGTKGAAEKKPKKPEAATSALKLKKQRSKHVIDFDPDVPLSAFITEDDEESTKSEANLTKSSIHSVAQNIKQQFEYNLYIIFYTNLCEAVDIIEESFTRLDSKELNFKEVGRIQECNKEEGPLHKKHKIDKLKEVIPEILDKYKSDQERDAREKKTADYDVKPDEEGGTIPNFESKLSLWSILKPYPSKQKIRSSKPISYPETHFLAKMEKDLPKKTETTSTLEHGVIDPNWQAIKAAQVQVSSSSNEEVDIEAQIEKVDDTTSVGEVFITRDESCQKEADEYVSDEEFFFDTPEDSDSEASQVSKSSESNKEIDEAP